MANGWDGTFMANCCSNLRYAREEQAELELAMASKAYRELPASAQLAIGVAWHRAKESAALHADCLGSFCEPWFDNSSFNGSGDIQEKS